jgi:hypothetical protein
VADAKPKKITAPAAPAKPRGWARPTQDLNAMLRKAIGGDKGALAEVREMLAAPGGADLLGGNTARESLRRLITVACGSNQVAREATERKLEEMRAELLGSHPTALERLLVERVVATWFHLHHLEAQYAARESMSLALGLYYQKCLTAAQNRYIAAIKGLADVRRLALPALQVNIARKQINVAGGNTG